MSTAISIFPHLFGSWDPAGPSSGGKGSAARQGKESSGPVAPRLAAASDEVALATRLRDGDESAVGEMIQIYASPLVRFAYTIIRDRARAESIAYDVLADIWTRREKIRPEMSLKGYLFTTVHRRALDEIEHERVANRYSDKAKQSATLDPDSYHASAPDVLLEEGDEAAELSRQLQLLQNLIDALPERRRYALHLRYEQGMSYPAIGAVLGVSDKAAQQLVIRTIGALRRELGI